MLDFELEARDKNSGARAGRLKVNDRLVETPAYVIVATNARIRTLVPQDIPKTKTQMVIVNTYHMWRDLGDEGLHDFPGLHEVMQWQGVIMTDSGGFQVFSLNSRVTESGVHFYPAGEGEEELYLDAEISIKIQEQLGGDIVVAFDEATSPTAEYDYAKNAMLRTHKWAERSLAAKESDQALYGVVQGGSFKDLREASAKFIGNLPFEGFGIGSTYGDAYGSTKAKTKEILRWSIPYLPEDKPRHLFGVGEVEDLFIGVEEGIDTFDCVIPTREARHGGLWTENGRFDIKRGVNRGIEETIQPNCGCPVCAGGISRGELYELFKSKNPEAGRLATIHNIYFFNDLMTKIRDSIRGGYFREFKSECLRKFGKSAGVV
jgi:queuine tRNA-ribosyltransferase